MASRSVPTPRVTSLSRLWGAETFWHQVITEYGVEHSALDRMLEHVLRIRFAEVVEREVLLGNVFRIKKRCHKNVIPRLHFRVAGSFLVAAERAL